MGSAALRCCRDCIVWLGAILGRMLGNASSHTCKRACIRVRDNELNVCMQCNATVTHISDDAQSLLPLLLQKKTRAQGAHLRPHVREQRRQTAVKGARLVCSSGTRTVRARRTPHPLKRPVESVSWANDSLVESDKRVCAYEHEASCSITGIVHQRASGSVKSP
jgi:hypothetical protein